MEYRGQSKRVIEQKFAMFTYPDGDDGDTHNQATCFHTQTHNVIP